MRTLLWLVDMTCGEFYGLQVSQYGSYYKVKKNHGCPLFSGLKLYKNNTLIFQITSQAEMLPNLLTRDMVWTTEACMKDAFTCDLLNWLELGECENSWFRSIKTCVSDTLIMYVERIIHVPYMMIQWLTGN